MLNDWVEGLDIYLFHSATDVGNIHIDLSWLSALGRLYIVVIIIACDGRPNVKLGHLCDKAG